MRTFDRTVVGLSWLLIYGLLVPLARAQQEAAPAAAPVTAPGGAAAPAAESVEKLTARVRRSLVTITSAGRDGNRDGLGSGFVIAADGLIATNYHVIGDGRSLRAQMADGRQLEITAIEASDRTLDLAVLRVAAHDLPALELGNSDELKQGQAVLAFGNPRGLNNSVVSGVVSGVREMDGRPMIQLAIPIEPGNSGGPLVDLRGRVQGVITIKSLVTPNLGFALTVNLLKPLVAKPNPIPMERWLTIGALDPHEWKSVFGAHWRQRAGRITVEGLGQSFGGRSLCLSEAAVPELPFEVAVTVRLNDESGAAGLAFCADGQDRHYGFYPTNGRLRLTRFDGPDVGSWNILHDQSSPAYLPGDWNTLRVRLEDGKVRCFVNDQLVVEKSDPNLAAGKVGLVKFRQTQAQFKQFKLGREVPRSTIPAEVARQINQLVDTLPPRGLPDARLVEHLAADAPRSLQALRDQADALEQRAAQLKRLADSAHEQRLVSEIVRALSVDEEKIDLFRTGLLVARLDNEEVDVDAYCDTLTRMGRELAARLPANAKDADKLAALKKYLFQDNGFHGSRGDYYNRANSYLNEVLDDREGLPITLSVVYMELAHRIGLPVAGIGLPGHFIVAYLPVEGEPQLIDVFDGATTVSRAEAEQRVTAASDAPAAEHFFAPVKSRVIITRMLTNLLSVAGGEPATMHRYLNAILAIEPDQGSFHMMRAAVRYQLNQRDPALEDVAWLLEHEPEGVDLDRVRQLQQVLQRQ